MLESSKVYERNFQQLNHSFLVKLCSQWLKICVALGIVIKVYETEEVCLRRLSSNSLKYKRSVSTRHNLDY